VPWALAPWQYAQPLSRNRVAPATAFESAAKAVPDEAAKKQRKIKKVGG